MSDIVNIADALRGEGEPVPAEAELIEKIEALPWEGTMRRSSNIAQLAFCRDHGGDVDFGPSRPRGTVLMNFDESEYTVVRGWMWVQFVDRPDVYVYELVPKVLYNTVRDALSPGTAHAALIKEHYRFAGVNLTSGRTFTQS